MRMVDVIEEKRDGKALSKEEIDFFIKGYVDNEIPDYQAAALAMAIYFKGMNNEEICNLTNAMMHSGDVVDLSSIKGVKVDKHSTGGVGDKTSLVLGPMVASCGAILAKMSGRGLGHTGGTLDKMESIPGMRVMLSSEEFLSQVKKVGMAIVGQTGKLVPADKKLYALRDVTATVDSIPLISSSIMSKKLASGTDAILLDVKFGDGAFMKDIQSASKLARTMVDIGKGLNRDTKACLTDMSQPLGKAVGNTIEVKEVIDTLQGHGPIDLYELCLQSGEIMLVQAHICKTKEEGRKMLEESITSGRAFAKFKEFVAAQGGEIRYIDNPSLWPETKHTVPLYADLEGNVESIHALGIGIAAMKLGAGRERLDDKIDYQAGILLNKKVGDHVKKGELLATAYTEHDDYQDVIQEIKDCFKLVDHKVAVPPVIHEVLD